MSEQKIKSTVKSVLKNVLKLVEKGVIPLESFSLLCYYYVNGGKCENGGKIFKLADIAKAINRKSPQTAKKYSDVLQEFGLIKTELIRKQGVVGFEAIVLDVTNETVKRLIDQKKQAPKKSKIPKALINSLLEKVNTSVPNDILPKKWTGPGIKCLVAIASKVNFEAYLDWFVKCKAVNKTVDWFSYGLFGSANMVQEFERYMLVRQKSDTFKDIKSKKYDVTDLGGLVDKLS